MTQNPIISYTLYGRRADWRLAASIGLTALVCSPALLITAYSLLTAVTFAMVIYSQDPQAVREHLTWELVEPAITQFLEVGLPVFAKGIIYATVMLAVVLLVLFAPTMAASLISSERQRQTLEVLLITLLTSRDILIGKLTTVLIYLLMPIAAIWALLLVSYGLQGIPFVGVIAAVVILGVTALSFSMLGLAASTFTKGLTTTMMIIYGVFLPLLFIIPPLVMSVFSVALGVIFGDRGNFLQNGFLQTVNFYGWALVGSLNPFTAVIYSAGVYESEGYFLFYKNYSGLWCPSPWLIYVLMHSFITIIAFRLSVWKLNRLSQAE